MDTRGALSFHVSDLGLERDDYTQEEVAVDTSKREYFGASRGPLWNEPLRKLLFNASKCPSLYVFVLFESRDEGGHLDALKSSSR